MAEWSGVKEKSQNGKTLNLMAKDGVILTSGGFGANVAMRQKYDTLWNKTLDEKVKTTNLPSITGDGINMAQRLGAATVDMGYIQLLPTTDPYTGATNHKVAEGTCIYVNKDGNRFVNELERRDVLAKAVGINAENLKKTVASWNEFCKVQKGDKFGRSTCLREHLLDEGPYWATIMTPSVHHTMGGLKINSKTQVMNVDGKPIEGLYAAGEITGGIHGTNRVGCNAVPDTLVFRRIAGTEVGLK
ncbi:MAG: FAD-binding protein [Duodenibacillus sp.]|nr:FAD-binding protein [Duodenibacillus sp.]